MAVVSNMDTRDNSNNISENVKKSQNQLSILLKQWELAKKLAGNTEKERNRSIKTLKHLLGNAALLTVLREDDWMRIWKGLFYMMWMSDKPLNQEKCAEKISELIHVIKGDQPLIYFKTGMQTLVNEWFGIDRLRLDKFMMFVRRFLRQALICLKKNEWNPNLLEQFNQAISGTVLNEELTSPVGLFMHFTEIFLEEFAKIAKNSTNDTVITSLLEPFVLRLMLSSDGRKRNHIKRFIFDQLIRQSDQGVEFQDKYHAWRKLGFPGTIDMIQPIKKLENTPTTNGDAAEAELDPRAGCVNVCLPPIKFDSNHIVKLLKKHKFIKNGYPKARKCLQIIINQFQALASGKYPFEIKKVRKHINMDECELENAIDRLDKFQNDLFSDKLDRKAKRKLKKQQPIEEDEEEVVVAEKRPRLAEETTKPMGTNKIDCIFKRNSGTWFVYKMDKSTENGDDRKKKMVKEKKKMKSTSLQTNTSIQHKKVKINTSLNQSQEVHEHRTQVLRSPGIPYDASKKPIKPLLKPGFNNSPINPFYKRKSF